VPYEILESAFCDFLTEGYFDKGRWQSQIKQFTKGANRSEKVLKHVSVLFNKNEVLLAIVSKHLTAESFSRLPPQERRALILCFFALSYPISYDILVAFAQSFKVQELVSKDAVMQKIGSTYGSNRAVHIAVTEIMPLLIDCKTVRRVKVGIYSKEPPIFITTNLLSELIAYTDIKLSGSKSILINDIQYRPWFSYFDISLNLKVSLKLLKRSDGIIGKGYLSI